MLVLVNFGANNNKNAKPQRYGFQPNATTVPMPNGTGSSTLDEFQTGSNTGHERDGKSPPHSSSSLSEKPSSSTKCSMIVDDGHETELCIEAVTLGSQSSLCFASMGGKACTSCVSLPYLCYFKAGYEGGQGYQVNCGNVKTGRGDGTVCHDEITWRTNAGSNHHRTGSQESVRYFANSGGSSGGFASMTILLVSCLALTIRLIVQKSRQDQLREDLVIARYDCLEDENEGVELRPVPHFVEVRHVALSGEVLKGGGEISFRATADGDESCTKLQRACRRDDWETVRDFFLSLRSKEADEGEGGQDGHKPADKRAFYHRLVGAEVERQWPHHTRQDTVMSDMLRAWVEHEPDNMDCRLLRADAFITWARHARTSAEPDEDSWQTFYERLQASGREMSEAVKLDRNDVSVYSRKITLAMILGKRDVERSLQAVATSHDPFNFEAHVRALQYYCKKRCGTHEKMFSFARSVTAQLPDGHPLWVLIPMAHYERNLIDKVQGYWLGRAVRSDIRLSYKKALGSKDSSDLDALAVWERSRELAVRNWFAYALCFCGLKEEARKEVRVIGAHPCKHPWNSVEVYKLCVQRLGFMEGDDHDFRTELI